MLRNRLFAFKRKTAHPFLDKILADMQRNEGLLARESLNVKDVPVCSTLRKASGCPYCVGNSFFLNQELSNAEFNFSPQNWTVAFTGVTDFNN